jgi:pimeloyl-ACP methyl ester carboxylesterase
MKLIFKVLLFTILLFINSFAKEFYIEEPYLDSSVNVQTYGNKNNEVIVFVHGLGDEASNIWKNSIDTLKDRYYILTLDLPGFGKSSKYNREYTPKNYSLTLNYIVERFINKPFYLIGHSMGGAISIKFTSMFPQKVKKLMLIDVAGILHQDAYSQFLVKMGLSQYFKNRTINEKGGSFLSSLTNIIQNFIPEDLTIVLKSEKLREYVFQSKPTIISAVGLVMEDFNNAIRNIKTETFILWGKQDPIAPIRTGYILNKLLENSYLKVIENSKHVPMNDSKELFKQSLKDFLNNKEENSLFGAEKTNFQNLTIEKQKNITISGRFENLIIVKSKNINIENASIYNLKIIDSEVKINRSKIFTKNNIFVQSSKVQITASEIEGANGFDLLSSIIDIAGVDINVDNYAFKGIKKIKRSKVISSISKISSNKYKNKLIHKTEILSLNEEL